ncbi:hypothetical protein F5884DRAFT_687497 [Xylogone sp. PMI_703]|nr:hypothetical protein F5884DRAFT_687497 [Xylogone sp. PMI_703]
MESQLHSYPVLESLYEIPHELLDLRPDDDIDHDLLNPKPISSEKNIWFYWHSGFEGMHSVSKRTVRTWYRRFSKLGWSIRVLNSLPSSPSTVANFLDVNDPELFPLAIRSGTLGGDYAAWHISDLVRFPLLLKYGGIYADVSVNQIGDLDRLWNQTVGNPDSLYEVLSYNLLSGPDGSYITNFFFGCGTNNPFILRSHRLLLALWSADGGKTHTQGMSHNPLLKGVPNLPTTLSFEENGRIYSPQDVAEMIADYMIQGQAMTMAGSIIDEDDGWNGPEYVAKHVYGIDFMTGCQTFNLGTAYDGQRGFRLMSTKLPEPGKPETDDQKEARVLVEACLSKSFGFKQGHGLITRVIGPTLGTLWRENEGSDNVPGTYAGWFRHATLYCTQKGIPTAIELKVQEPKKRGHLLRD